MIYFYHHYELPYVLQQAQLQQVIIQRQQQQQQQHHQHQHQHQPAGSDSRGQDVGSPVEVTLRPVQNFSIMDGLHHLGRLRAVLLRRRRVRTSEPPQPPPTPPAEQNTSEVGNDALSSSASAEQSASVGQTDVISAGSGVGTENGTAAPTSTV